MSDDRFTLKGRLTAFGFALKGLQFLWAGEPTTRFHAAGSVLAIVAAWALGLASWEWALVILMIGLVWFAEAVNSALERACDAITLDRHPMIGKAKDLAAASVLIMALTALGVAVVIFGPHVLALVGA
ncbi:diacylglycerol kinase [Sphingomicrobium nitratireducens]|uniref:diacylglycerol kinase n=1 Tax=Sphingomicrobium nitratireducens TaxID=2964666 RepID=UPI00223F6ADD|nr:diacylglycerol kinase family protein [Sphingomicrobium nitratireducens]